MDLALAEARRALAGNHYPCGCVIVEDGRVTAAAGNRVYADGDPTRHAEMAALHALFRSRGGGSILLRGATAYVTTTPCLMCTGAFLEAGLTRIVFGAETRRFGAESTPQALARVTLDPAPTWIRGVRAAECTQLLTEWRDLKQAVLTELEGLPAPARTAVLERRGLTAAHIEAWQSELSPDTGAGAPLAPKPD